MTPTNSDLEASLAAAGDRLEAFAAGPAQRAADAMEAAFARAGAAIEREIASLARTGEADLERLARALVETLAQAVVPTGRASGAAGSGETGSAPVSVVMNVSGEASSLSAASGNQIAAAVARAVRRGARWM